MTTTWVKDTAARPALAPAADSEPDEVAEQRRRRQDEDASSTPPAGEEVRRPKLRRSDLLAARGTGPPPLHPASSGLLYTGHLHALSGEPGGGKSVLAGHLAIQVARAGGNVLWIDEEAGDQQVSELLTDQGITDDELEHRIHHYAYPGLTVGAADTAELLALARTIGPQLAIVDSAGAALQAAGLDENGNPDVTAYYLRLLMPVARIVGAAVLVLDHETKDGGASRYSIGAGAKLRSVDVMWKLSTVSAFHRHSSGRIRLTCTKDRRGVLGVGSRHDIVVHVEDGFIALEHEEPAAEISSSPDDGLKPAERKLLDALQAAHAEHGRPVPQNEIVDTLAARHGHGLRRETASKGLNELARLGLADRLDFGQGIAAQWTPTQPAAPGQGV